METVDVFRFEKQNDEGLYIGPYNIQWEYKYILRELHSQVYSLENVTPAPYMDKLDNGLRDKHLFACPSLDELYKWFDGFIDELLEEGFCIAKYTVPQNTVKIGKSKKQVTFDSTQIVNVTRYNSKL